MVAYGTPKDIPNTDQLDALRIALVGPGRVGTSLGLWFQQAGASVEWVLGRSRESARGAAARIEAKIVNAAEVMHHPWNLLLVAVPDQELSTIVAGLAAGLAPGLAPGLAAQAPAASGRVALHTSGSHSAECLAPLQSAGVAVGSLHPLLGFSGVRPRPEPGVVYGIDGDDEAMALAERLAVALGGQAVAIPADRRLLYHYCATLAAGGVTTVAAVVDELIARLELGDAVRAGLFRLSAAAIDAAGSDEDAALGITGPIARGDDDLAAAQLQAAARLEPRLKPFLDRLHAETRRQVRRGREKSTPEE